MLMICNVNLLAVNNLLWYLTTLFFFLMCTIQMPFMPQKGGIVKSPFLTVRPSPCFVLGHKFAASDWIAMILDSAISHIKMVCHLKNCDLVLQGVTHADMFLLFSKSVPCYHLAGNGPV